jgi:hypothetical protein
MNCLISHREQYIRVIRGFENLVRNPLETLETYFPEIDGASGFTAFALPRPLFLSSF